MNMKNKSLQEPTPPKDRLSKRSLTLSKNSKESKLAYFKPMCREDNYYTDEDGIRYVFKETYEMRLKKKTQIQEHYGFQILYDNLKAAGFKVKDLAQNENSKMLAHKKPDSFFIFKNNCDMDEVKHHHPTISERSEEFSEKNDGHQNGCYINSGPRENKPSRNKVKSLNDSTDVPLSYPPLNFPESGQTSKDSLQSTVSANSGRRKKKNIDKFLAKQKEQYLRDKEQLAKERNSRLPINMADLRSMTEQELLLEKLAKESAECDAPRSTVSVLTQRMQERKRYELIHGPIIPATLWESTDRTSSPPSRPGAPVQSIEENTQDHTYTTSSQENTSPPTIQTPPSPIHHPSTILHRQNIAFAKQVEELKYKQSSSNSSNSSQETPKRRHPNPAIRRERIKKLFDSMPML